MLIAHSKHPKRWDIEWYDVLMTSSSGSHLHAISSCTFFLSFLMEWLLTFAWSNKQRAHAPSRRSIRSCYYSRMDFFHISTDWEKALSLILVAKTWRIIHRMEMSFCASKMHASDILILCIWENALSMWAQKNSSKNLRFTYLRANQFKNFVFPL